MLPQNAPQASENPPKQSAIEVAARLADPTKTIAEYHFEDSDQDKWKRYIFQLARHTLGIPFFHDILCPVRDSTFALGEPERLAMDYTLKTWLKVHFGVERLIDLDDDNELANEIGLTWAGDSEFFDEFRAAISKVDAPKVSGDFWGFATAQASNDFSKGDHPQRVKIIRDKLGLRSPFQILALHIMHQCDRCYNANDAFPIPQAKYATVINEHAAKHTDTFKGRTIEHGAISRLIAQLVAHGFLSLEKQANFANHKAAFYSFKI